MPVTQRTKLNLAFKSGGVYCKRSLIPESAGGKGISIGEAAHIFGEKGGTNPKNRSARHDPNLSPEDVNGIDNLIYVCRNCHKMIDAIPEGESKYLAKRLKQIKAEHEAGVVASIKEGFSEVGFEELRIVTKWVEKLQPNQFDGDYSAIYIEDKIKKNALSLTQQKLIVMGLFLSKDVGQFIAICSKTDPQFPHKLKAGLSAEQWTMRANFITRSFQIAKSF